MTIREWLRYHQRERSLIKALLPLVCALGVIGYFWPGALIAALVVFAVSFALQEERTRKG